MQYNKRIMKKEILKDKDIKLVVSDFDGVFTDGKIEVYSDGTTSKKMDYKDIMGVANILKKGLKFAIISGETSQAISYLKKIFPQIKTFENERKKINVLKNLLEEYGIPPEKSMYFGDDINDLKCLNFCGVPVTVANAHPSVKQVENIIISEHSGGNGAFREITDYLL